MPTSNLLLSYCYEESVSDEEIMEAINSDAYDEFYEPAEEDLASYNEDRCPRCGGFLDWKAHTVEECEMIDQAGEFLIKFTDEELWPKSIQDVL